MAEEELAAVCRRLRPRLVGALSFQVIDAAVAEELAQEALVRLCERWPQVQGMRSPEAWTYRVAANLAASWWRRQAAERRARRRHGGEGEVVDDVSQALELRQAVAALPPRQREVVVLRFYLRCSVGETAEAMGCAEGTVKAATSQALQRLQAVMSAVDRPRWVVREAGGDA